ncbi:MAG: hypothetical protein MJY85_04895 [Fibrobacter sp.]|nr:hypothetical protein [Fibrobacter sp.]
MDIFKNLAVMSIAAIMLIACGGDNGSSARDDDSSSSVADEEKSSSSTKNSSSSDKESSSSAKESSSSSVAKYVCDIYTLADALSCKCDENREGELSYNYDSDVELVCIHDEELNKWGWVVKKEESSSSSAAKSSSSAASSSSAKSSSSVIGSQAESSGDACIDIAEAQCQGSESKSSSSTAKSSSSSAKSSSSSVKSSSSSAKSSSSSVKLSSSSYEPYDHTSDLGRSHFAVDPYKQFTDERNGRSYYYITIDGVDTSGNDASVTIMAENLNIGVMIDGEDVQENDDVIERFCYNNDTTKCDRYGGLYQWAEMMQLPSRCNIESCADSIPANQIHQGICPTGWRLMTYNDLYIAWHAKGNEDGLKGLRSASFNGFNTTGLSLTGAGYRETNGTFVRLTEFASFFYPRESLGTKVDRYAGMVVITNTPQSDPTENSIDKKLLGASVRCVMVE